MTLARLALRGLRNLADLDFELSPRINLICGANGSGKTSLLEGVHLLSLARSFRTQQPRHYIAQGQRQLQLYGKVVAQNRDISLGLERSLDLGLRVRVDGRDLRGAAELARLLPLQIINADTFQLLSGRPEVRRQFMDWGSFHARPGFLGLWQGVRRCLRQRNSLLKHGRMDASVRAAWDLELVRQAEALDQARAAYVEALKPRFAAFLAELAPLDDLSLDYHRGWDVRRCLDELLEEGLARDCEQGFTLAGPQRADLRLRFKGAPAVERLSRGQQKLVVSALKLAQGDLMQAQTGRRCLYLVDDLPAELDAAHRQRLCGLLETLNTQVLVTSTQAGSFEGCWLPDTGVSHFYLEAGALE